MFSRVPILFLVLPLLLANTHAKDKKRQVLPDYVLQARTILVVIHPDATEPLNNPMANRDVQSAVEKAMKKWGRFDVVLDAPTADLIIAVRKGIRSGPIITHSLADRTTLGGGVSTDPQRQSGHPPSVTEVDPEPPSAVPVNRGPQIAGQSGSSEDTFEVYRGGSDYPLDSSPVWRYAAKDALNPPQLAAVEQFQKAVEESEKQQPRKP
jgi:hypothetical protein